MAQVVYNITVSVNAEVHDAWLSWMRATHVKEVLDTGCFSRARLLRIHAMEHGGITYAVQYEAESMEAYNRYQTEYSSTIRAKTEKAFPDQVHVIRTVLEVVECFDLRS